MRTLLDRPDFSESYDRCLALVRRYAPKFMRAGGGGLQRTHRRSVVSAETRARIVSLRRAGRKWREIAEDTGVPLATCSQTFYKATRSPAELISYGVLRKSSG